MLSRMFGAFVTWQLVARMVRTAPMVLSAHSFITVRLNGSQWSRYAIINFRFASLAAAIIALQSVEFVAIGFSHSTCLPALSPRIVYSACMLLGSTM
ncbi:hypothetical protein [Gemmata massiliana]|uniref:hypothetical protein n=1 Tax=Gemmata massiliana TaxID=1210884 RepID=UPI001E5F2DE1|nr:hypothetical protein [Gemmata massiliana]